jgi:hypothetical protein
MSNKIDSVLYFSCYGFDSAISNEVKITDFQQLFFYDSNSLPVSAISENFLTDYGFTDATSPVQAHLDLTGSPSASFCPLMAYSTCTIFTRGIYSPGHMEGYKS